MTIIKDASWASALTKTEAADIAEKCAELISERGHAKGNFQVDGAFCLFGAINYYTTSRISASKYNDVMSLISAYDIVSDAVIKRLNVSSAEKAVRWNDRKGTSKEDVVLLFKHVAEDLRQ